MPSEATNSATMREWRELGFFYDRDDEANTWTLTGSQAGLLRFRDVLFAYVADPGHAHETDHEHFGPYQYLKVMTSSQAGFAKDAVYGSLRDLSRLAAVIERSVAATPAGTMIKIRDEFSAESPYVLILDVREDGFDPASADPALQT